MSVLMAYIGFLVACGGLAVPEKLERKFIVVGIGVLMMIIGLAFREQLEAMF